MNAQQRAEKRGYVFKRGNDTVALIKARALKREYEHELRERHPEEQSPAPMGWSRRLAAYDAQHPGPLLSFRQCRRFDKKARKAREV